MPLITEVWYDPNDPSDPADYCHSGSSLEIDLTGEYNGEHRGNAVNWIRFTVSDDQSDVTFVVIANGTHGFDEWTSTVRVGTTPGTCLHQQFNNVQTLLFTPPSWASENESQTDWEPAGSTPPPVKIIVKRQDDAYTCPQ